MHNGKYQCHMAASCVYHLQLSSPSCSTRAIQKSLTLNEKYLSFLKKKNEKKKKSGERTISKKNDKTETARGVKAEKTMKKNKRGDRKGESNDSPEIPERRVT